MQIARCWAVLGNILPKWNLLIKLTPHWSSCIFKVLSVGVKKKNTKIRILTKSAALSIFSIFTDVRIYLDGGDNSGNPNKIVPVLAAFTFPSLVFLCFLGKNQDSPFPWGSVGLCCGSCRTWLLCIQEWSQVGTPTSCLGEILPPSCFQRYSWDTQGAFWRSHLPHTLKTHNLNELFIIHVQQVLSFLWNAHHGHPWLFHIPRLIQTPALSSAAAGFSKHWTSCLIFIFCGCVFYFSLINTQEENKQSDALLLQRFSVDPDTLSGLILMSLNWLTLICQKTPPVCYFWEMNVNPFQISPIYLSPDWERYSCVGYSVHACLHWKFCFAEGK